MLKAGALSDHFSYHSVVYCVWKIKNTNITTTIRQQKRVKSDMIINDLIDINWDSFPFQITDVQNAINNSLTWSINMPSGRYLRLKHSDN